MRPPASSARFDDAADVAHVLARRQLGHDAAPLAMDVDLRGDDVRPDAPGPRGIAGLLDDGRGRLVARGLDPEQVHVDFGDAVEGPLSGVSLYGGPKMPLSVMMPVM